MKTPGTLTMTHRQRQGSWLLLAAIAVYTLLFLSPLAAAAGTSGVIAQGFANESKDNIVTGALVSFAKKDSVELATTTSASRIAGVVDRNPLVAISGSVDEEVQVVLSGSTQVLVSDINGAVKLSDKITASPIKGVGMRATSDSQIVGTAQADFSLKNAETRMVKDTEGVSREVHINYIPLQVGIAFYQAPGSDFLPPFVQNLANAIAGRPVALMRILITGALLLFGAFGVGALIYSSVRSAMASLGRNPLAAGAIRKSLYQVGMVSVSVLGAILLASYLVLTV